MIIGFALLISNDTGCDWFNLSLPIGWNEFGVIVSVLGVVATVFAIWVALNANKKASQQIKSALDIHEQSKSISLFEERACIIDAIDQGDGDTIATRKIRILFNEDIEKVYSDYLSALATVHSIANDINYYFSLLQVQDGYGGYSNDIQERIENYEAMLDHPDCPPERYDEFKDFCEKHEIHASETGSPEDWKCFNYYELFTNLRNQSDFSNELKRKLIEKMEQFLSDSIKPIADPVTKPHHKKSDVQESEQL